MDSDRGQNPDVEAPSTEGDDTTEDGANSPETPGEMPDGDEW